ncbi:MAG: hypothetical protein IT424_02990 [Pirellulales bacterium]|nr:hypothetical protein [Pirellulales bacterium]
MTTTIVATYDGHIFRPTAPVALSPNTAVKLIVEPLLPAATEGSFLRTARQLNLEGPPDWSRRLDDYLYGGKSGRAK